MAWLWSTFATCKNNTTCLHSRSGTKTGNGGAVVVWSQADYDCHDDQVCTTMAPQDGTVSGITRGSTSLVAVVCRWTDMSFRRSFEMTQGAGRIPCALRPTSVVACRPHNREMHRASGPAADLHNLESTCDQSQSRVQAGTISGSAKALGRPV